ncbi:MAG TPA: ParB N-terminal domain-containing protein [Myxococcaceae bacterium]|nr:ParB N-terminal domain-containing protein [Myxococcaceae bacterium]
MSADFPHDVDSPSDRASREDTQEGSASPAGSTPVPPSEAARADQGERASGEAISDPGPALALDALQAISVPSTAEVLTTGPDGELERLGSIVPPSSDAEILEVLASLQFEGGRVVSGLPDEAAGAAPSQDASDEAAETGDAEAGTHDASGEPGEAAGGGAQHALSGDAGTLGVLVSQAPPPDVDGAPEQPAPAAEPRSASPTRSPRALPGSEALPELAAAADEDAGEALEEDDEDDEEALTEHLRASVARRQAPVPTTLIALDRLDEDTTFRVREEGDISRLATDLARVGQLFPIDVRKREGDRFQVICGFRRLAALRFLHREFVIARVHADLRDEDAQLMALAAAIHAEPVELEQLEALRDQLESEGRLVPAVRDMLDKALAEDDGLAPELAEEEIDADELASDVSQRLGAINQELSMLADVFASLEPSRQAELLMQLRYSSELVTYLEGQTS